MKLNKNETKDRSRVRTLLDRKESDNLALAVIETGTNKSFLIFQAIEYGLRTLDPRDAQGKRIYRTAAWVPRTLKNSVKELSICTGLTQQSILRLFLSEYLKATPWKEHSLE